MAAINISEIMDGIGRALLGVSQRIYPYPTDSITVPCFVVAYPEIEFDVTFNRGSDYATFPVYYVAGSKVDRNTRDELSAMIAGSDNVKNAIDGDLDGLVGSAVVTNAQITQITVNNVAYMAIEFTVEVYS